MAKPKTYYVENDFVSIFEELYNMQSYYKKLVGQQENKRKALDLMNLSKKLEEGMMKISEARKIFVSLLTVGDHE